MEGQMRRRRVGEEALKCNTMKEWNWSRENGGLERTKSNTVKWDEEAYCSRPLEFRMYKNDNS